MIWYGRGYSDRPKVKHTTDLYIRQLFELLEALKLTDQKINLIGFSLGAGIAASFAVQYPQMIERICLIDPVHPEDMPSAPGKIWQTMSKIRFLAIGVDQKVIDGLQFNFYNYEDFPDFEEQFSEQMAVQRLRAVTHFDHDRF